MSGSRSWKRFQGDSDEWSRPDCCPQTAPEIEEERGEGASQIESLTYVTAYLLKESR